MSNKLKKMTEEERKKMEDEAYLRGRPNREEVANYVNSLMENHYMPSIMGHFSNTQQAMQLGFMVIQAILIQKGICTKEEISEMTQEFINIQKKEQEKEDKENKEDTQETSEE